MRITAAIALFLLALSAPAHAHAGTFVVPFGSGTPMSAAGWVPRADAPAVCGFEGGTVLLNAGTLGPHDGCLYLFNAPASAQIASVTTTLSYVKASTATALCAYSFAGQPGDTLRRCGAGTFTSSVSTSLANWVELGLYNEGGVPIALATSRANNVTFASGWVTVSDPTPPALSATGPTGVQAGSSAELQWAASDPESGAPAVTYAIDGGARVTLRGQACSWLCGTGDSGTAAIDLGALADGPHSLTVYAQSYADADSSVGPLPFSVDRSPPAQAVIKVERDPASTVAGWWGHAPIALTISSSTEADVVASALWVYGPTGALVFQHDLAGALRSSAVPASALLANGAYRIELLECDGPGHCSASTSAAFHWDGDPPPASIDAFAPPLGLVAARDGAHLRWPALPGSAGLSGIAGAYLGIGAGAASARAQALAATHWEVGAPGVSEAAIPAGLVHGSTQVCLAVRLLSGAGLGAGTASVRCAAVDELPPEVAVRGALTWSSGPQAVELAASDANGASFSEILLDGAPVSAPGGVVTVHGEGTHVLRVVARDAAGNETVDTSSLGVDSGAPAIGSVSADFVARELRVDVADALSGVALVEVRLAGTLLDTRLAADGRTAVARVPDGLPLDGATVSVRALDGSSPVNTGRLSVNLPSRRLPALRGLGVSNAGVGGRVVAPGPARVQIWAYPKGRVPRLVGSYPTRADGSFAVSAPSRRTTRYAVGVLESQGLLGLAEQSAGTVRVTARITGLKLRAIGRRLLVRARFGGRGEATRLHLLVHDLRGGRWVEGCLEHGRPGVHLERTGRVWGSCRIPRSARGRAWTYRLVLAAPSSAWPWSTPSSASSSVLLPL